MDGKQYLAVTTGLGGGSPQNMPNVILTNVHRPDNGQALYVFALRTEKVLCQKDHGEMRIRKPYFLAARSANSG
jgi:hypothetical protein